MNTGPDSGDARRLILVRHAKAAWPDVPDAERPLAPRGRRDAPAVGRWLRGAGVVPDLVVCSTARRTRQTWKLIGQELAGKPRVSYDGRLYEGGSDQLLEVIQETDAQVGTLLLVGHNPSVQALTLALAGSAVGDAAERAREQFPTSSVAVLSFTGDWSGVDPGGLRLVDLAVPRG